MNQNATRGAANQRRYIGAVIRGGNRGAVAQANAVDKAHIHIDDLKALLGEIGPLDLERQQPETDQSRDFR